MTDINRLSERVRSRITVSDNGCWLYSTSNKSGYAQTTFDGVQKSAHRYVYELLVGPIPKGLEIDHLCRVKNCVNPEHLEAVTHKVNIQRGTTGQVARARQRAKTHCPQGHPYDEENTYRHSGRRNCRACRRDIMRKYKARKKANA